ncbi:glycosyltransferase [Leptolyngbya sp. FACHB-321]|uniref:glycosyltransferase n=1 Tax=Leptolyngbya sp. FACHB-321 TaxID=2692807 RepID=UPI00168A3D63|nr:glycosyltransferase [Leptolyngbya sp. FACHB-321]MBD2036148.1 glycosyltransferase [Leptolyngbya sp. FACHB-321]
MTHFGIISPTGSHLTTHFVLGYELQRRGHRVTFLNILDAQDKILAADFGFRVIGESERPIGSEAEILTQRGKLSGIASLKHSLKTAEQDMRVILQDAPAVVKAQEIEALLVDQCSPVGGTVADYLKIPFISLCAALPLNRDISIPPIFTTWSYSPTWRAKVRNRLGYTLSTVLTKSIRQLTAEYRQKWNLPPHAHPNDNYSKLAQLSQQPAAFEFPRALPPHFHFTGPYHSSLGRERVSFPWDQLTGQPLVYASMGTIQNQIFPVFETIAAACVGLDVQLVLSLGGGMPLEAMSSLPGQPLIVSYAPQLELLQRAALTITHAGLNTVLESLTHGVPMVAIPIANDQPGTAARIVWAGVGELIALSHLTVASLRSVIHQVLTQDSYRVQALRLKAAIQSSGGVQQAASIIESVLASGKPVLRNSGGIINLTNHIQN